MNITYETPKIVLSCLTEKKNKIKVNLAAKIQAKTYVNQDNFLSNIQPSSLL